MIKIKCSSGSSALVDDQDGDLAGYNWHEADGYPARWNGGKKTPMHREVLQRKLGRALTDKELPDHVNGNPLDNRRENLRACSHSQNSMNRKTRSSYGYKGIDQRKGKFRARIRLDGKDITSPYYKTVEEAAHAHDTLARLYFGEFARLNFP